MRVFYGICSLALFYLTVRAAQQGSILWTFFFLFGCLWYLVEAWNHYPNDRRRR